MPPRKRHKPAEAQRAIPPRQISGVARAVTDQPTRINAATIDLAVELGARRPLRLERPVVIASGPLGFGLEAASLVDLRDVGLFVTRTATLSPQRAGLPPRLVEVPGGLLHAVGRENPGITEVVQRHASAWREAPCAVAVSLATGDPSELRRLFRVLDERAPELRIDAIEFDLTAPCDALDGAAWESSLDESARLIDAARDRSDLPLIAKLSPQANSISRLVAYLADAGADIVSISGSPRGFLPDRSRRGAALASGGGHLSGPLIRPLALAAVVEAAAASALPIIGGGGVGSPADALDYLVAGADAVSVGSALWADPALPGAIAASVRRAAAARGVERVGGLVGIALGDRAVRTAGAARRDTLMQ